ncbi:uncharacterized protein [Heterodontus francisci]|uniref:uncharacterized protein isoform X2 n=1 Tax=Heterodontus francisci TaxID=7792 RepID=UPI00355C2885
MRDDRIESYKILKGIDIVDAGKEICLTLTEKTRRAEFRTSKYKKLTSGIRGQHSRRRLGGRSSRTGMMYWQTQSSLFTTFNL